MALRRLVLRDFVIVPTLELDIQEGFSALTGETGAGKSILIDALQLLLGGRSDASWIRQGQPKCELWGEFDVPSTLVSWLEQEGFEIEDEHAPLLLRRSLDASGKSRAWINGRPAMLSQLKTLANALVDIHGQHAWQNLARPDAVRQLLDGFGAISLVEVHEWHQQYLQCHRQWQQAQDEQAHGQEQFERLSWQIAEIEKLAPQAHEWDELNADHQRLANAQALQQATALAIRHLSDGDHMESDANSHLHAAIHALETWCSIEPQFLEPIQNLQTALAWVDDAARSLGHLATSMDQDPERLQALDERLRLWHSLARRFRLPPQDLAEQLQTWQQQLADLAERQDIEALEMARQTALHNLTIACLKVTEQRRQAAHQLAQKVNESLKALGMGQSAFSIVLRPLPQPGGGGAEAVEFLIATHPGATPQSVAKVASGGEMSRIALAISVATSEQGHAPTLIFDEVDAGIGGAVAHTVGQLMRDLGFQRQVLAVTHLAQVASYAHHHLWVSKQHDADQTTSTVTALSADARINELARMLDGKPDSALALEHARELLVKS